MVKNNIGVIILVSAIVAVVTSIVTGLIVANVNLSPQKIISDASGTINAHKCMADGVCEVNSMSSYGPIDVGGDDGSLISSAGVYTNILSAKSDLIVDGDIKLRDNPTQYPRWILSVSDVGLFELTENLYGQLNTPIRIWGGAGGNTNAIEMNSLAGSGSGYVCADYQGVLYRSVTPCV